MALQTCIIAPDRVLWDGPADEVLLSATSGSLGLLEGHAPLLTALDIGPMRVRSGSWQSFAVMGGFATVQGGRLTVIVNEAYASSDLNADEVTKELDEARTAVERAAGTPQAVEAQVALRRAKARYDACSSQGPA
jgi:F-type H+-transporting ATPase subunit epsilon|uniref:ATP synthase epsilon chain, chloroplastic n=1 Tax=Chloroparvula japonica TaxID=1411623 RepID=A0A4D6C4Y4_9CHLO|nr:CF1 epsilon subunit of ATP synthase [Chloroparvula japonica]QBX98099.1 CF1 epsilon subunit of ATP synthase [Chloroparvula japonica]